MTADTLPSSYPNIDTGYAVIDLPYTPPSPPADTAPPAVYAGQLEATLDTYMQNPDQLLSRMVVKGWVGMVRPRRCTGAGCNSDLQRAWIKLQAVEDADEVVFDDVDTRGVVIARAVNVARFTDAETGMVGGEHRYLLVRRNAQNVIEAVELRLVPRDGGHVITTAPGDLPVACHADSTHRPQEFPHADFQDCDFRRSGATDGGAIDTQTRFLRRAWMACVHGCCTSGFPSIE